jgi:hypothetical protein
MKAGIVVLVDDETNERARAHSKRFVDAPYTLVDSGCIPHISIVHMRIDPVQKEEALAYLKWVVSEVTLPPYIMGELATVTHTRNKWMFWNVQHGSGLDHLQTNVRDILAREYAHEALDREYPYWGVRYDPHITLASSPVPDVDVTDVCTWCGETLAVVTLGNFGEILEVVYERDLYARQVMHVLTEVLPEVTRLHARYPTEPKRATRKHDGRTPYGVHPTLAVSAILHERALSPKERLCGALTLAFHDVLEDTTAPLPPWVPAHIVEYIAAMCFESSTHEMETVWSRTPFIRMCKLYDKWSNLYDTSMKPESLLRYCRYARALSESVRAEYPELVVHALVDAVTSRLER